MGQKLYSGLINALALAFLVGCVAPGTPRGVQVPAEVSRKIPGCTFIAQDTPRGEFVSDYYLTTYGSSLAEGASAGANSELQSASDFAAPLRSLATRPFEISGEQLLPNGSSAPPLCMTFSRNLQTIREAVAVARGSLSRLGYESSSVGAGFRTSWRRGGHSSANWFDRYTVVAVPTGQGQVVVAVRREVYIQRAGFAARFDDSSLFHEATSVGANEAWVLASIRDSIR